MHLLARLLPDTLRRVVSCSLGAAALFAASAAHADTWTVLGYISADNSLEAYAVGNVNEMVQVGTQPNLNVVVQIDRALKHSQATMPGVANFAGTRRFVVQKGALQQVADLGDPDGTLPATISDFITWGIQTYPADHYAVVFWDHGGGWVGSNEDETGGSRPLTPVSDLKAGIQQALQATGKTKLDLLGFDECLMSTVEVASSLSAVANTMVASQELEPGEGWDYAAFLNAIVANNAIDSISLGKAIADGYQANVAAKSKSPTCTLAVLDLTKIGELSAVGDLASAFVGAASQPATWPAVERGRTAASGYGKTAGQPDGYGLIDLGLFAGFSNGWANTPSATPAAAVKQALSDIVVYKVAGAARGVSSGLSIYLPQKGQADGNYLSTEYAQTTAAWAQLIAGLAGVTGADNTPPAVAINLGSGIRALASISGDTVTAKVTADDVAEVDFLVAQDDGKGGKTFLGSARTAAPAADGSVSAKWDKTWSVLTDGQTDAPIGFYPVEQYADASGNPAFIVGAPAEVNDDGTYQAATLMFTYDPAAKTGAFLGAFALSTTSGSGELPLAATDKVRPMVVTVTSTGDYTFASGTTELTGASLALKQTTLTSGNLSVGFMAWDQVGNVSTDLVAASGSSGGGGAGGGGGGKSGCSMGRAPASAGWVAILPLAAWIVRRRRRVARPVSRRA